MVSAKQQRKMMWIALFVLSVLLIATMGVNLYYASSVNRATDKNDASSEDKICMRKKEYNNLIAKPGQTQASMSRIQYSDERDRKVLSDPLYPALNRSETDIHNGIVSQIVRKQLYNNTQEFTDKYRLVAYVTSKDDKKDAGGNTWKLMARQSNKSQGEFYMIPANTNYDMKIMINNDIVTGEKLRDIYTIPKEIKFNSPLLNASAYEVTELPMNDFTNSYN